MLSLKCERVANLIKAPGRGAEGGPHLSALLLKVEPETGKVMPPSRFSPSNTMVTPHKRDVSLFFSQREGRESSINIRSTFSKK